jgi:hypothetical protein
MVLRMNHVIGRGSVEDNRAIRLDTRRRRHIPNEQRLEQAPHRMAAAVELQTGLFREIEPLSATAVYNCAGLVFGCRRTWIDIEDITLPLADDGFEPANDPLEWKVGDVGIYRDEEGRLAHVGLVHEIRRNIEDAEFVVMVVSAWGQDGEYLHRADHIPVLLGRLSEVRTQRRSL